MCGSRWLKIEVTAQQKCVFPWCRLEENDQTSITFRLNGQRSFDLIWNKSTRASNYFITQHFRCSKDWHLNRWLRNCISSSFSRNEIVGNTAGDFKNQEDHWKRGLRTGCQGRCHGLPRGAGWKTGCYQNVERSVKHFVFLFTANAKYELCTLKVCTFAILVNVFEDEHSADQRRDLMSELEVMRKIPAHPHVVKLLGCVTKTGESAHDRKSENYHYTDESPFSR